MNRFNTSRLVALLLVSGGTSAILAGGDTRTPRPDTSPDPMATEIGHLEFPVEKPAHAIVPQGSVATAPASTWERNGFVSVQVNVNSQGHDIIGDAANEPSIAVDPTNMARMAIGWRQFDTIASNFRQSGVAHSQDSGRTWTFPGVLEPGVFSSDPVLDYDANGRFYYYALQPDRGPGSWGCYMYRSEDGGVTWPQEVYAWGGDKAWMTVDRTGGLGDGHIYIAWSVNAGCCGTRTFTRSTDGGVFYMWPIEIPQLPLWGTLTVDLEGRLFIVGGRGGGIFYVVRSSNAKNAFQTPVFDRVVQVNLGGSTAFSTGPNPAGLLGQAWIAADHSDGPTQGNLYVLASVDPPGGDPLDVMFIRSTDGGLTWSSPVRVNDDPSGNNAWQWFGTMSVAPNGRIDVIWNDTRNDFLGWRSELYYASSMDGGQTWSENIAVSPAFNHFEGYPQQEKLGDYYDMISDDFGAHVAYAATFNGGQDVYYVRLGDFDCNNNGVPDEQDIANETSLDCNANLVPDECDTDCNDNGCVDYCETRDGLSADCDANFVPDECDPDFDGDGIIDGCDDDIDDDGVPNASDVCPRTPAGLAVTPMGNPKGDENRNCVVDLADMPMLVYCLRFGPIGEVPSFCHIPFDFDLDLDFDLADIAGFQRAFGQKP